MRPPQYVALNPGGYVTVLPAPYSPFPDRCSLCHEGLGDEAVLYDEASAPLGRITNGSVLPIVVHMTCAWNAAMNLVLDSRQCPSPDLDTEYDEARAALGRQRMQP